MPLQNGNGRGIIGGNIREMMHSGFPQKQAVAASLDNARRHPRADGGGIDETESAPPPDQPDPTEGGGIAPSAATQDPMIQNMIQRYQGMSAEQLQELAARLGNSDQGKLVQQVLNTKHTREHLATGGMMSPNEGMPFWSKGEERDNFGSGSGLLHSAVAGRTDHLKVSAPSGSYVIPADVVSGIGQGNTMAGARQLHEIFTGAPYGAAVPKMGGHSGAPRPPAAPKFAKGGKADDDGGAGRAPVPILGAGGEYIVHPKHIAAKFGSVAKGHKILDKWVVQERERIAKEMLKLPGPVKD